MFHDLEEICHGGPRGIVGNDRLVFFERHARARNAVDRQQCRPHWLKAACSYHPADRERHRFQLGLIHRCLGSAAPCPLDRNCRSGAHHHKPRRSHESQQLPSSQHATPRFSATMIAVQQKARCNFLTAGFPSGNTPGSDLLSHAVAHTVPSAVAGLTSVFGMGTGVTLLLSPPGNLASDACQE